MRRSFYLRLPAIVFACVIFILSQIPGEMFPPNVFDLQDKLEHFVVYFIFGITLIVATATVNTKRKRYSIILIVGMLYALLDEVHQLFVPGRFCDITDFLSDSLGIALSLLFVNFVQKYLNKILYMEQR